ncbi:metal-dependent hydrolase [Calothrix rhizosoleniae]|uniref:metal-dependent hydrolase n=1 Tax=Calothrix rhizosoleniae TaxID=888997 RepID=UPI000B499FB5
MPSPIAHSVSGYILGKILPLEQRKVSIHKTFYWQIYAVFVAIFADFDFIPQLITGEKYHRGLTHSLSFTLGFSAILALIVSYLWKSSYKQIFLRTFLFYISHLCLDFFSEGRGIKLFLPFIDSFFRSPVIIFPGFHYSMGLWSYSHILTLTFELVYSTLLFFVVCYWQKTMSKKTKKI